MKPETEFEFKVGEEYENEKGCFTVLQIVRDRMRIQYASGETVEASVAFQTRVQIRRMYERREDERVVQPLRPAPQAEKRAAPGKGRQFFGLVESDFKTDVTGTHWRNRNQLGGAVTRLLSADRFRFNSWPPRGWPIIYWGDERRRDPETPWFQAKFLVRLTPDSMFYGFYVERMSPEHGRSVDFENFLDWLRADAGNEWLLKTAAEHDLRLFDLWQDFPERLMPQAGSWCIEGDGDHRSFANLADFFDTLPAETSINPVIVKTTTKARAVARGTEIAQDLADLFVILMPIYEAAVGS